MQINATKKTIIFSCLLFGVLSGYGQNIVHNSNFTLGNDNLSDWSHSEYGAIVEVGQPLSNPQSGYPVLLGSVPAMGGPLHTIPREFFISQPLNFDSREIYQLDFYAKDFIPPGIDMSLGGVPYTGTLEAFVSQDTGLLKLFSVPLSDLSIEEYKYLESKMFVSEPNRVLTLQLTNSIVDSDGLTLPIDPIRVYLSNITVEPSLLGSFLREAGIESVQNLNAIVFSINQTLTTLGNSINSDSNYIQNSTADTSVSMGEDFDIDENLEFFDSENLIASKSIPSSKENNKRSLHSFYHPHVWARALGQYMYQGKTHNNPSYKVGSGGVLIGSDWRVQKHAVGASIGYVYSMVSQDKHGGHANLNQGVVAPYSTFNFSNWNTKFSLLCGYCHVNNHRYGNSLTTDYKAISNFHSWQLAPHAEFAYFGIFKHSWFNIEPFVMGDYVANWQSSYKEKDAGIFNANQKSFFSSFIRAESGLRFSEKVKIKYGYLTLKEKGSYAYQRTIGKASTAVVVVGSPIGFSVANAANIQSLGVFEFAMNFLPLNTSLPTVEVAYEGQFGSVFQTSIGSINVSKDF